MPKIENVLAPSERMDRAQGNFSDLLRRTEQYSWVDITLERDLGSERFANFAELHAPIHAQHICSRARRRKQKVRRSLRIVNDRNGTGNF